MSDSLRQVVVGSGPAALGVTEALLARGLSVTVVDVGDQLEPELRDFRQQLAGELPAEWPEELPSRYRELNNSITDGITRFGSKFAMRDRSDTVVSDDEDLHLQSSHALGGLSNFWGSAVLPWPKDDMASWPVTGADLADHYRAVSEFLPIAGGPATYDSVLAAADLKFAEPMPPTCQEARLVPRLESLAMEDGGKSVWAGAPRKAVGSGCQACGLCLYGCPYGVVFSTAQSFEAMRRNGRIEYVQGEVTAIREEADQIHLEFADGRSPVVADKGYLATGVIETARIIFASCGPLAERGLTLRDSGHVFSTFLHKWSAGRVDQQPHHALSIGFLDFRDAATSPYIVHNQIYGWNDFYLQDFAERYCGGSEVLNPLFRIVARRLMIAQTFLHSDHCASISLEPESLGGTLQIKAAVVHNDEQANVTKNARARLKRHLSKAGLFSVGVGGFDGAPGSSFHTGATLPMSNDPVLGQSDVLGRPFGYQRLHIVDASVMPAIPATTITFSVMANAHRIGSLA